MTPEEVRAKVRPEQLIRLSCSSRAAQGQGYVGELFDDHFEFFVVTNTYEHFSNISAPPELVRHVVHFADVIDIQCDS